MRAMMSRTTASTSSDTSRLVARKAAKRVSKSGSARSRRSGMANPSSNNVARARGGFPGSAEIGEARLDIIDVEPDRRVAGKDQLQRAGRRFRARHEADGEQGEHVVGPVAVDAGGADRAHRLEMQRAAAALVVPAQET